MLDNDKQLQINLYTINQQKDEIEQLKLLLNHRNESENLLQHDITQLKSTLAQQQVQMNYLTEQTKKYQLMFVESKVVIEEYEEDIEEL